jgi:hypothetical protein
LRSKSISPVDYPGERPQTFADDNLMAAAGLA